PPRRGPRGGARGRPRPPPRLAAAGDPRPVLPRQPGGPDRRDPAGWRAGLLPRELPGLPRAEARRRGGGRARRAQAGAVDRPGGGMAPARPRGPGGEEPPPAPP